MQFVVGTDDVNGIARIDVQTLQLPLAIVIKVERDTFFAK